MPNSAMPDDRPGLRADVAIVGGGYSGTTTATHLLRRGHPPTVVVVEPRATLGAGLAYSTPDPAHRINVPAARMSALVDEPTHFVDWLADGDVLRDDPAARREDGALFVARAVFGRYVAETLTLSAARPGVRLHHAKTRAIAVAPAPGGFAIRLEDGETLWARAVVLAVSHPPPTAPGALRPLLGHPALLGDPYGHGISVGDPQARVLIVGTGLTFADTVASLAAQGHTGPILAVSRRGLRSRGHAPITDAPEWRRLAPVPATALGLSRAIRAEVAKASAAGRPWQDVFDTLRWQGPELWGALPTAERQRLVRRLRPFWDVHRFRIAPQPAAAIARAEAAGQLRFRRTGLREARTAGDAIAVRFDGQEDWEEFDRVVLATGPEHASAIAGNPALASLQAAGRLRPDACRLGIDVDGASQVLDTVGDPVRGLFVAGPLARGRFGELMGLPDVTRQAAAVAEAVTQSLVGADPLAA